MSTANTINSTNNSKNSKNNSVSDLARKLVQDLVPYASARSSMSGGAVWLNANENALAPEYQLSGSYNRYPECQPPALIAAYAEYAGISPSQLLVSRGADEGIEFAGSE